MFALANQVSDSEKRAGMVKKIFLLLIVSMVILIVCFNKWGYLLFLKTSPIATDSKEVPAPMSDDDFYVTDGKTIIVLRGDYRDLKTDEKIVHARYADERRAYSTFVYENFTLSNGLKIFGIILKTSVFETSRGIRVGDSISDVFEKYGIDDCKISYRRDDPNIPEYYRYDYNYSWIIFYVNEDKIITKIILDFL